MASLTAAVRFTANFEANLEQISTFWAEQGAPQAYSNLLDEVADKVIGNLERHPRIGRKFFARSAQSAEVHERVTALLTRFGDTEVREYLSGDYLLLYCVVPDRASATRKTELTVYLLAVRHQRQLSFDFDGFWQANRAGNA